MSYDIGDLQSESGPGEIYEMNDPNEKLRGRFKKDATGSFIPDNKKSGIVHHGTYNLNIDCNCTTGKFIELHLFIGCADDVHLIYLLFML